MAAILFLTEAATAQRARGNNAWKKYRHEIALGYGVNNIFASLGERSRLGVIYVTQRSTINANYRYYLHNRISVRASATQAYARKNDKNENLEDRVNIRMDYKSSLSEFAIMGEYHLMDETGRGPKRSTRLSRGGISRGMNVGLSVYAGFSASYIRPYGEYFGDLVVLKPVNDSLGYLPNNNEYQQLNFHVPVGLTFRFILNDNWRVGAELGYRIGFREYINNVSGVYYHPDGSGKNEYYADPSFTGGIVTYSKNRNLSLQEMDNIEGKTGYYFGMVTLAYRIKTR